MAETYGTRPLSWYSDQASDYLDGEEENDEDREVREEERERQRRKLLRCVRR